MKLLILGAKGQLGQAIYEQYPDAICWDIAEWNIGRKSNPALLESVRPDVIINCAAMTNTTQCEEDPEGALAINGKGVGQLAQMSTMINARLIHVSTDYVFDGKTDRPYKEDDKPNPLNEYGKSKLEGEKAIEAVHGNYAIVRTAFVFGPHSKNNIVESMANLAGEKDVIKVEKDTTITPTYAPHLAAFLIALAGKEDQGIFHYAGQPAVTIPDFFRAIFDHCSPKMKLDLVDSIPSALVRPSYSALDCSKAAAIMSPPSWKEGLDDYFSLRNNSQ